MIREVHPRGAMSLVNVAYASTLTWGDLTKTRLEDQALAPMFGDHPVELGLEQPGTSMLARLQGVDVYRRLFSGAFPMRSMCSRFRTSRARSRCSSGQDHLRAIGEPSLSLRPRRCRDIACGPEGEQLFFSQPLSCFRCHNGFNFSGATGGRTIAEGAHRGVGHDNPNKSPMLRDFR